MIRYYWTCPNCKEENRLIPLCSPELNPKSAEKVMCYGQFCFQSFSADFLSEEGLIYSSDDKKIKEVIQTLDR
jgi:hypothetical protein